MPAIPFALSVQHFINSVGADAGFAAVIGLAILVLLYFAQARETATLREQVEDSADHIQHLEHRLEQVGRTTAAPAPVPGTITPAPTPAPAGAVRPAPVPAIAAARAGAGAPVSARRPVPVPVPVGAPAAPAGVGAPALSAATRLIPADPSPIAVRANGAERAASPAPAGAVMTPPSPPPATAAGGANGGTGGTGRVPMAAPAGAGATGVQPPLRTPGRTDPPVGRAPAGPPRRPAALPPRSSSSPGRSGFSRVAIALVTLLGVVAVVIVLLIVTSSGGQTHASSSSSASFSGTNTAAGTHHRSGKATPAAPVTPAAITVAVLNATTTAKLAESIATRLQSAGFKRPTAGNASDHTQTATVVGYLPHHRAAALLVARSLKLGPASVQAVDQSNETVACQASSTPCAIQVVVTVGSDLVSTP